MSLRRVASARPPPGGATRSFGHGLQLPRRAGELSRALLDATAFLFGAQLDAIIRAQATGALSGMPDSSRPATIRGVL